MLKEHFDKLLLTGVITLFLSVLIYLLRAHPESAAIAWIEKSIDLVTGSLLTLITGQVMQSLRPKEQ